MTHLLLKWYDRPLTMEDEAYAEMMNAVGMETGVIRDETTNQSSDKIDGLWE